MTDDDKHVFNLFNLSLSRRLLAMVKQVRFLFLLLMGIQEDILRH